LLRVPSAIIPESFNLIFNPTHRLASRVWDIRVRRFEFDSRLLRS
jgi:hypothetical protein